MVRGVAFLDQLVAKARNGGSLEEKERVLQILGELEAGLGQLPDKMQETRRVFHVQVERDAGSGAENDAPSGDGSN